MKPRIFALSAVLVACTPPGTRTLALPATAGASAIVVVERLRLRAIERRAIDLGSDPVVRFTELEADDRIDLIVYREALSALHLKEGPLDTPATGGRPIRGTPLGVRTATLSSHGLSGWSEEAPSIPARIDLPVPSSCPTLTTVALALSGPSGVNFVLVDGDSLLLARREANQLERADRSESRVVVALNTPALAGWRASDGRLWLGLSDSHFSSLAPGSNMMDRVFDVGLISAIDGPPLGSNDLFLASSYPETTLYHYDGTTLSVVLHRSDASLPPSIAWLSPGEALYSDGSATIRHVRSGTVSASMLHESSWTVQGFARLASGEILVGASSPGQTLTGASRLYRFDPALDAWPAVPGDPVFTPIRNVLGAGDGLIYTGKAGAVAYWDPIEGFCPQVTVSANALDFGVQLAAREVVLAGDPPGLYWVTLSE